MIHVSVSIRGEDGNAFRVGAASATQREILTCALLAPIRRPLYIRRAKVAARPALPSPPASAARRRLTPACKHSCLPAQFCVCTLDNL
ncbi:hypothetical protein DF107_27815 [Burkholderia stagnalis]|uniref:Uncharacterized protein n=1 Tax=Burkholderia stagnalis TaxID=1503054 RepID=A0A6L3MPQ9_9BURK|nr:hypothetical protein F7R25_27680 [Burkholderia stagnalis]RQQ08427.1 hypothetical protein DF161_29400 [Burkholderia stagnalis]RQQ15704.1 hypothetical protein DF164_02175 [Burkholderia stagnalis]RQQ25995.1 hypothetical protein DF148_30210 [Burkholderia stagnalis]RQQ34983.1 hypothetical protein DF163_07025 [Burkholderia stagnalis]